MQELATTTAIDKLLRVMSMLRDSKRGCPWDVKQTAKSLIPYTLEEVYEVIDAIESEDIVEIEDELGDLLFQVVFYAQIGKEQDHFDFESIANAITNKLLRRHPHVFPEGKIENFGKITTIAADQVEANWEAIKAEERRQKSEKQAQLAKNGLAEIQNAPLIQVQSSLDSIASAIPALQRANKIQSKVSREGFDWDTIHPVLDKLKEEIAEFEDALKANNSEGMIDELGDILFATVNVARHADIEPETALRSANEKFSTRYRWIEAKLAVNDKKISDCAASELDALWNEAKQAEA